MAMQPSNKPNSTVGYRILRFNTDNMGDLLAFKLFAMGAPVEGLRLTDEGRRSLDTEQCTVSRVVCIFDSIDDAEKIQSDPDVKAQYTELLAVELSKARLPIAVTLVTLGDSPEYARSLLQSVGLPDELINAIGDARPVLMDMTTDTEKLLESLGISADQIIDLKQNPAVFPGGKPFECSPLPVVRKALESAG